MKIPKEDQFLIDLIQPSMTHGPWIAGGAVMKWIKGLPVGKSDVDVFVRDERQASRLDSRLTQDDWSCMFTSSNAKSYKRLNLLENGRQRFEQTIQIIHKEYFDSARQVINNFDLTVCQFLTDGENLICGEDSFRHLNNKILVVNKLSKGLPKRLMKYISYGYTPTFEVTSLFSDPEYFKWNYQGDTEYDNAFV